MLLHCDQKLLAHALKACLPLGKLDPFLLGCQLVAQAPVLWPSAPGQLLVCAWSERAEAGVLAEIPALVARAGTLSLPFQPLTDVVAALHPGTVQLWHGQVSAHNALAPMKEGSSPAFLADSVLVLEQRTTPRSQRSRVRSLTPAEQALATPWNALHGSVLTLGQVSVKQWRQALAPCLLLTKEHAQALDKTPEMDHTQVLIRFEPTRLSLVAATPYDVVRTGLSLQAAAPVPFTHAGFSGEVLDKMGQMVTNDPGPLTLQVVSDPPRVDLRITTPTGVTLVCRGTLDGLSLVWERPFRAPARLETRVERKAFTQACASLAVAKHHADWNGLVRFQMTQGMGVFSLVRGDEEVIRREVPLLGETPDAGPVWVHLARLRRLVRQFCEPELILQWGKHGRDNPLPLDGLQLSSKGDPQRLFIMMLSVVAHPSPSQTPHPQEVIPV